MDLYAEQERLEEMMADMTVARFERVQSHLRTRKSEDTTSYGAALMRRAIDPLAHAISGWMAEASTGKAGRSHAALKYIKMVKPEVAALITSRNALSQICTGAVYQRAAMAVATGIEDELRLEAFDKELPKLRKWLEKEYANDTPSRKRRALVTCYNKYVEEWDRWPDNDKLHLGTLLLTLFCQATGFAEVITKGDGGHRKTTVLIATQAILEWVKDTKNSASMMRPQYLPMVVPPADWEGSHGGGYITHRLPRLTLVKSRNRAYLAELSNGIAPDVLEAVNNIQRVGWKINSNVLETMETLWASGGGVAKLASAHVEPLPQCPLADGLKGDEVSPEQKKVFMAWKRKAAAVHTNNAKIKSRRLQGAQILSIAQSFAKYDDIYFPHQMDFRGRVYAVPMFLNPQGADQAKGLLTFSEGKPLKDGTGAGWLAVQGANVFGIDKVSFEDRVGWVEDNILDILACADDPSGNLWWTGADKPWQFLAFCFEWAGFQKEGFDFVSHIPVALDGSCSGLQHFSAALRDPIGGAAVNLVPNALPADIYNEVIEKAAAALRLNLTTNDFELVSISRAILAFGLTRAAAKRPTMTISYGSTQYSCRGFVLDWIRDETDDRIAADPSYSSPLEGIEVEARAILADLIWIAIGDTVIAARGAMGWLKGAAKALAEEGLPVTWTTPDGLPLLQAYQSVAHRRVKTKNGDKLVYLTLVEDIPDKLDVKKQVAGLSPNWVHSMDGTHLRMAVNLSSDNGLKHFSVIHDSFGCHAADTPMLAACLRQSFVSLYERHVLQDFADEVGVVMSEGNSLPVMPPMGTLDMAGVLKSDFMFA